jgi:glutamate--cysteine ligase
MTERAASAEIIDCHCGNDPSVTTRPAMRDVSLTRSDLVALINHSGKPRQSWAVGPEFEIFGYRRDDFSRLAPADVQIVLSGFDSSPEDRIEEDCFVTELSSSCGRITLEPGGQVELSGWAHNSLSDIERNLSDYLTTLHGIAERNGFVFLAAGFDPFRRLDEQHWIPKNRYRIMKPYMASRGTRAWDMMTRTCAIQANLDYLNEVDLAKKFLLGNRLGPIVAAMFANSPFENGQLSEFKSIRYAVWLDTDPDRSGVSPAAIGDFSVDRFVEYTMKVPMFFARRQHGYVNLMGASFERFLDGDLDSLTPQLKDFTDHLTTIFTDARIKPHVELRSADSGNPKLVMALQALWKGLMYDDQTLDEALRLAPKLDRNQFADLQLDVARNGLAARQVVDVLALAKETVRLADEGLRRIAPSELHYLDILTQQVIDESICPADILIKNWRGDTQQLLSSLQVA